MSADNVNKQKAPILGDIGQVVVRSKVKDLQEFEKRSKVKDPESNDEINHYQGDVIKQTEDLEEEDKEEEEEEVVKSQEEAWSKDDVDLSSQKMKEFYQKNFEKLFSAIFFSKRWCITEKATFFGKN